MTKLFISLLLVFGTIHIASEEPIEQRIVVVRKKPDLTKLESMDTIVTDLSLLHPAFRNKVIDLLIECSRRGIKIHIQETYRSITRQNKLRKLGSTITTLSGSESRHQYGLAIDLVPYCQGTVCWDTVGRIGERLGLGWGGRWRRPYDPGHFEWKTTTEDLLSQRLPLKPDTIKIPI